MGNFHEKILVVEDDVQIRNFICYALKSEGFTYITAGNAQGALKKLVTESVDMMLLDLGLPDADGMDVIRRVREDVYKRQVWSFWPKKTLASVSGT